MKKIIATIAIFAITVFAGCNSYGSGNWKTTDCYHNGTSEHWNSYNSGNFTNTTYSNSNGVRGNSNQYNYGNGNYDRTYTNNQGYRSTTTKLGNTYYFNDNQGNRRTTTCYGGYCTCTGNACK